MRSLALGAVVVLSCAIVIAQTPKGKAQPDDSTFRDLKKVSDVGLKLSADNKGASISVDAVPELDPGAVRVNFEEVDKTFSRADAMRVVLQSISALVSYKPTLVVFSRAGKEQLLLDGKVLPEIAFQFDHDKPLPAWRMFAEQAARPDGTRINLPDSLLARTTASFALADELIGAATASSGSTAKSALGREEQAIISADKWKVGSETHGEVVAKMLGKSRSVQPNIKDGTRLDNRYVESVLTALSDDFGQGIKEARIALLQREQGGTSEIPEGSSELVNGLKLRYQEIFPIKDDSLLFPLTRIVEILAPESTFAGLTVYGKHGEVKTRITGKYKVWYSGGAYSTSGYETHLETDKGHEYYGDTYLVRWGDIKNKIAFDFSSEKLEEDRQLEMRALR